VPRPEPDRILDLLEKFRPSILPGVSTIFVALLNNERFQKMDLSFVKAYLTGSAPMAVDTIQKIKALRDVPMINVYGLTEIYAHGDGDTLGGRRETRNGGDSFSQYGPENRRSGNGKERNENR